MAYLTIIYFYGICSKSDQVIISRRAQTSVDIYASAMSCSIPQSLYHVAQAKILFMTYKKLLHAQYAFIVHGITYNYRFLYLGNTGELRGGPLRLIICRKSSIKPRKDIEQE
jgi:hypothetical protein